MKKLLLVVLAALAVAPVAEAGCMATVQLSSLPTARVWNVTVKPLQHGRRLLPDAKPRIEIRTGSGPWKVFHGRKTAKPGVFAFRVVFSSTGTWRFHVWDGFEPHCARYHTYSPVTLR